ncbi:hypothetical protein IFM89_030153 [Coptis chinensis]|uniref:Proton pump-interactor 1 n=1 Tax=Coptis chinensis TaxID=261450 RepID=A0A835LC55_9MAGN|nr:hypothetical protein IFM89_030153 [Coptis chinensis]
MGVEVVAADITQVPVKDESAGDEAFEIKEDNGTLEAESVDEGAAEPIKFGSHGTDVPIKEGEAVKIDNLPKDAVDEWPEPKKVHSFYFVKVRPYEDPKLKIKIDQAEKEIQKKNQARFQLTEAIKAKRSERAHVISQLKPLGVEDKQFRTVIDGRRKEMEPLNQALGKLRSATHANRERGVVICSSEEELNGLIQSLNYRIQHESNTLVEEKQLLRDIKQLEGTRERVIANAALKAKIEESLGEKTAIQDQVKLIGSDLDGVRKDQQAVRTKIKQWEEELKTVDNQISSLQEELTALSEKRDKAYEGLVKLRKQRDEVNTHFYQNRSFLNNARELAAKKDIAALEELSHREGEKFVSLYSSNKSFRADYEKRILQSLDQRQLSRDARMRNPDEKPLVQILTPPAEPEVVAKSNIKRPKEDSKPSPPHETLHAKKVVKEDTKKMPELETITNGDHSEDRENIISIEKSQKAPLATNAVDPAKLKEMKREEEIAKAKLALERKKKLAEKAAAKASARAEKEAEKKLKESIEREKRAKKKAGISTPAANPDESVEPEEEVTEPEKDDLNVQAPTSLKTRERKESTVRYRNQNRGKGQDPLHKLLKRKKSTPYWFWAAPAAVLVVILLALSYYYLL